MIEPFETTFTHYEPRDEDSSMPTITLAEEPRPNPVSTNFNLEGHRDIQVEQHPAFKDIEVQLLHWHYHLNHLPFK